MSEYITPQLDCFPCGFNVLAVEVLLYSLPLAVCLEMTDNPRDREKAQAEDALFLD